MKNTLKTILLVIAMAALAIGIFYLFGPSPSNMCFSFQEPFC